MDVEVYIASGILEEYCLGLLAAEDMLQVEQHAAAYPQIRAEIHAFCQALEQCALLAAVPVPAPVKNKLLDLVDNLAKEERRGKELPLLHKYSNPGFWLDVAKPLLPEKLYNGFFTAVLRSDEQGFQCIIWTSSDIPDEVHHDMRESFIILEGTCECLVGDETIYLGPGGFLEIPLHTHHSVKTKGGPVLAVLQRLKIG